MLIYTCEDYRTSGVYCPTYLATYQATLDEQNNITAFNVKIRRNSWDNFGYKQVSTGAVGNYQAGVYEIEFNITVRVFMAQRSKFIASAEQSFLDELA